MAEQCEASWTVHAQERQRHLAVIHDLATATSRPVDEVIDCYEQILRELKARARIADFLPILVAKRVREIYRLRIDAVRKA